MPGAKQRAVLAALLLAHRDGVVSAERLIDELWGDDPPATAVKSLQVHVSQLRRLLGDGQPIVTRPTGYAIELAPGALDLERFERALDDARRLRAAGDLAGAAAALRSGLELFRGTPLADVELLGRSAAEGARLESVRLSALEDRVELDLALGEHVAVIAELEGLVAEHPYRERLHAHLMLALYRAGRQADALDAYRRARTILVEELGIDPGPELQRLEAAVLAQDSALELDAPAPRRTAPAPSLPAAPTGLVGRAAELDAVSDLLRAHRLVTILGPGGVGKSRLALELAHRLAGEFRDGARFVALAAIDARDRLDAELAQAVDDDNTERLLVLDNFEQLVDAAPAVSDLLARAPGVRVLVTSQAALRISGEREIPLAPLAGEPAVELFVARARDAAPDDPAVAELCARLDGLPLAIELAAARTRLLAPAAILERLGGRLDLLTGGPRDAPARQRTLRAAIEWSHDLLSAAEQDAFARLAVFAGGWSVDAAEAVLGDVLDTLEALVDRSLVVRSGERFGMLESIHAFARERLADDAVRARHAAWALELAEAAAAALEGPEAADWLRRLDVDHENLVAAAEWAIATGDAETAQRLCGALWRFWLARGAVAEGRRLLTAALGAGTAGAAATARAENAAGVLAGAAGDHEAARAAFTRALAFAREAGDRAREARVTTNLGVLHVFAADYERAQEQYEAAEAIWRELGDVRGLSVVTQNLGIVHEDRGDFDGATALLEESVALAREAGEPSHVASTLHVLGSLVARRGDDARAVPLVRESLELSRTAGEGVEMAECLETLAGIAARAGDPITGATLLGAAEAYRETTGAVRQPDERTGIDATVAAITERLSADALAVALERGRRTDLAAAVTLALGVRA
ncbi:MAG TPA: BTAD domain-containing putative transcriptional regulator [Solirubrobacteraceae bacterium]|nr:BTAD domain-containing putative transcriptional regulator [Solirubrobacteraceae bacterium]